MNDSDDDRRAQERAGLLAEADEILQRDDVTDADLERVAELTSQVERGDELARQLEEVRRHAAYPDRRIPGDGNVPTFELWREGQNPDTLDLRRSTPDEVRDAALRVLERGAGTASGDARKCAATEAAIRDDDGRLHRHAVVTNRPEYRSAFGKYLSGRERELTAAESGSLAEVRAMSLTDANGGYAVPFTLDPTLIVSNSGTGVSMPWDAVSKVVVGSTDTWQGLSSDGVTASWDAEGVEVSDDAWTLDQPVIVAHKAAAFVPFSLEIGGDYAGLAQDAAMLFADASRRLEAAAFTTGTGSSEPFGLVTRLDANTNVEVSCVTAGTLGVGDVYNVYEQLPERWRANARWIANIAYVDRCRQFATGTGPQHAFLSDLTAGQPPVMLGLPFHENGAMTATLSTAANNAIVVGDFSQFGIYRRAGMSIELVPHLFGSSRRPTGQRGWYAWWRVGADVLTETAFRLLQTD